MENRTGTGSSFWRHFGEKPNFWVFLGPIYWLLWAMRGRNLGPVSYALLLNIPGKFLGHSSRASHICQVRHVGIFGPRGQGGGAGCPKHGQKRQKFRHGMMVADMCAYKMPQKVLFQTARNSFA